MKNKRLERFIDCCKDCEVKRAVVISHNVGMTGILIDKLKKESDIKYINFNAEKGLDGLNYDAAILSSGWYLNNDLLALLPRIINNKIIFEIDLDDLEKDKRLQKEIVLKARVDYDRESFAKLKEELTMLGNKLPKEAKGYKILTKDRYIENGLCGMNPCDISKETIRILHERWDKLRKGYDFVILAGDMTYSVDYFNTVVLGGRRKQCISKDDISFDDKIDFLYYDGEIIGAFITREEEC